VPKAVAPRSKKPASTKRAMPIWIARAGLFFARRLIDTVLRNNLWQFKKVRAWFHRADGQMRHEQCMQHTRAFESDLFVLVIVVALYIHDTLARPLERSTTPDTDTFVYRLLDVSHHLQKRREKRTARNVPTPIKMMIQLTCSYRSRPVVRPRPPPPIRK